MGNMNEEPKVDILGSINNAAREAGQSALGMAVVAVIIGVLIAPIFAPLFENGLKEKYQNKFGEPDYALVRKKMALVTLRLWGVALAAWIALVLINVYWKY